MNNLFPLPRIIFGGSKEHRFPWPFPIIPENLAFPVLWHRPVGTFSPTNGTGIPTSNKFPNHTYVVPHIPFTSFWPLFFISRKSVFFPRFANHLYGKDPLFFNYFPNVFAPIPSPPQTRSKRFFIKPIFFSFGCFDILFFRKIAIRYLYFW